MGSVNTNHELLVQLKNMKLKVPDDMRQRVQKSLIENSPVEVPRQSKVRFPRWIYTCVAVMPALALLCWVAYGITETKQSNKKPNTTAVSKIGYDYQKELGFQPMLPNGVSLPLTDTSIMKDIHSPNGDKYDFNAIYGSGNASLMVAESHTSKPAPQELTSLGWKQRSVNGETVYEIEKNGIKEVSVTRDGVQYTFIAREKATFDMAQLETLVQKLDRAVTQAPHSMVVQTHGEEAVKASPFSVFIPRYIPEGFVGSPQMTSVKTEGSFQESTFIYTLTRTDQTGEDIQIMETLTQGHDPATPSGHDRTIPASDRSRKIEIAGHLVTVFRNDGQHTTLAWDMPNGVHVEVDGTTDLHTMIKIVESMDSH